jgi:transposase InsO family protein
VDRVWVADLTHIPTAEGWLYVAGVLDRCSRRVLGLAMAARLDTSLPAAALRQALMRRGRPKGVIHHSESRDPIRFCSLPPNPAAAALRSKHEPPGQLP